jgi:hypothetical protein
MEPRISSSLGNSASTRARHSPAVAPAGTSTDDSATPVSSRARAKKSTFTFTAGAAGSAAAGPPSSARAESGDSNRGPDERLVSAGAEETDRRCFARPEKMIRSRSDGPVTFGILRRHRRRKGSCLPPRVVLICSRGQPAGLPGSWRRRNQSAEKSITRVRRT